MVRLATLSLVAFLGLAGPTMPAPGPPDLELIRGTIERQLTALRRGRAGEAFSLASPRVREEFGTPARFLRMVRQSYAPLVRHRGFTFLDLRAAPGGGFLHAVRLVDREGGAWIALYALERDASGAWTIAGCTLDRAPGEAG